MSAFRNSAQVRTQVRPQVRPQVRWVATGIALALLAAIALRTWSAVETSLWLDELHSLSHASQRDAGAVLARVRKDFHAPAFFLFLHLFGGWEEGAWLRWIPIVSSLLVIPILAAIAGSASSRPQRMILAVWLYACIPYQVHYGAELRPYAWVALFSAGAVWAGLSEGGSPRVKRLVFFVCALLGMQTHRLMALSIFAIGVARLLARRLRAVDLRWLIGLGALAVAPSLPWLVSFASWATDHRVAHTEEIGRVRIRPVLVHEVLNLPPRLIVPYMNSLGGAWASLAKGSCALLLLSTAAGIAAWLSQLRRAMRTLEPRHRAYLTYTAVAFALITVLSIYSWDRVPLQYYAGVAWVLPLVIADLVCAPRTPWLRACLCAAAAVGALMGGIAVAGGHARENVRDAVQIARAAGERLLAINPAAPPLYSALLAQPGDVFDNLLPYRAYGRDLDAREPISLPRQGDPGFERPLIVVRRVLDLTHEKWKPITQGRVRVETHWPDPQMSVLVFLPESSGESVPER